METVVTEAMLDFNALLAPIPGQCVAGQSIRYTGVYDAIQEARRADDNLPQGEWKRDVKVANWSTVISNASRALAEQGKDLQVAVWLAEALVKQYAFPGARDGLRLLRELTVRFWDSLYPTVEDGDFDPRAKPFEWLDQKLAEALRSIPLTHASGMENYDWLRWEESRTVDNLGRQNSEVLEMAEKEGKITGDQFDKAIALTPRRYYESLSVQLNETLEQCRELIHAVDEKFGRDAPSLLNIKGALEDCQSLVERILKKKQEQDPTYQKAAHAVPQTMTMPETGTDGHRQVNMEIRGRVFSESGHETLSLEPTDRADALRRLGAVAAYFRRWEPHSPVAYLIERAVHWGEMPLEQWLSDVISNDDVLSHVRETLGLRSKTEPSHS